MPKSIFILPNLHLPFKLQALSEDWPHWILPTLPPESLTHRILPTDVLRTQGGWSLPLPTLTTAVGYNVHFQTCDKEVTPQLQIFPLPNPQSCCPELKMSIKRVHKLTMTCWLYDLSYRKYMPPHTLDFQFNSGPVSFGKLQFSNYSAAWSWNCQSLYILDNTIPLGLHSRDKGSWRG